MLRISVVESSAESTTLRLDGQVMGRWVEELRRACESPLKRGVRVTLDLKEVSFIGQDGITLLKKLKRRKVTLANVSAFVAEQLRG